MIISWLFHDQLEKYCILDENIQIKENMFNQNEIYEAISQKSLNENLPKIKQHE